MGLSLEWTKQCQSEKERQDRIALVEGSPRLLEVIQNVLSYKLYEARRNRLKTTDYSQASWPYRQADFMGYERALTEVIQLTEIRDHNNNDR